MIRICESVGPGRNTLNFIARFQPTDGFSIKDALYSECVTIVGRPPGVSYEDGKRLKRSGWKVRHMSGSTPEETRQKLDQIAASGKEFEGF